MASDEALFISWNNIDINRDLVFNTNRGYIKLIEKNNCIFGKPDW